MHLPAGISFFTFQSLSYLIDVYRRTTLPQGNIVHLGLYIALFPQLIAGPIVRYHDVAQQILKRYVHIEMFAEGIERFIWGLSKKVLIANPLGKMADIIFSQPVENLSSPVAWLGISSYTLQIYFDFSGYSDMAIGLGKMFGFTFLENFNYPYVSRTLREFWTRWHISLSTWFRDYLYIPLGGNRGSAARTAFNLITVFFLCGLWHGASWNFVIWGLFHGTFLLLERGRFGRFLKNLPQPLLHIYVLLVVMVAWVFFRAETVSQALVFLQKMFDFSLQNRLSPDVLTHLTSHFFVVFVLAVVFSLPVRQALAKIAKTGFPVGSGYAQGRVVAPLAQGLTIGMYFTILLLVTMNLATGSYNPFIYFRF
ncbi:MAG: MBOAT family O-acyltransferase [Desulfoprunum sp.]|nr:MBOAT family O-acyltransferase [Desulfoprunum sp.]